MPKLSVKKSIVIKAPLEQIRATVRDFRQWRPWSPWLIAEPDCKVTYAEDGNSYAWEGQIIGSGEMDITSKDAPNFIGYRLKFLKPWKSVSDVSFTFEEHTEGVELTWSMDGSIPVFLFWMKDMMTAFIGMDYQRGLSMLKDQLETGSVPSRLEFLGRQSFTGFNYFGVRTQCSIADVGPRMEEAFKKLREGLCASGEQPSGKPFSIYHDWDPVKGTTDYTVGFPVDNAPSTPPGGLTHGNVPTCQVYSIKHTGPYRHLGNVWSAGMMHGRAKVFEENKANPSFETYENSPEETEANDLVTIVHLATK